MSPPPKKTGFIQRLATLFRPAQQPTFTDVERIQTTRSARVAPAPRPSAPRPPVYTYTPVEKTYATGLKTVTPRKTLVKQTAWAGGEKKRRRRGAPKKK